jgi:uridine phosphorylase
VFLPGSDGRAGEIASRFDGLRVLPSPRRHNLYLGTLRSGRRRVDVAAVATGMGCPSVDIVVQELFKLGARRFLRVGTAGSLQPDRVRVGHLVVATGGVRDEGTSAMYVPREFPAIASLEVVLAAQAAARKLRLAERTECGIVHCKDSLFAREFGEGPMAAENRQYMDWLKGMGVVASEMESSHLFVLASLFDHQLRQQGTGPAFRCVAGTVLAIIGDDRPFAPREEAARCQQNAVALAL